jgi:lipopolysaccharide biosynthesis glycosyltransferase
MTVPHADRCGAVSAPLRNDYLIATAIDAAFVEPACVLLASIAANAAVREANLVVYGLGLTQRDRDYLTKSCGAMADRLSFIDLDFAASRLKKLPVTLNVPSVVAYARMLVPSLLPRTASRLLYLDSDIVVMESLRPLFETSLTGAIVAAVPDPVPPWIDRPFRSEVLKLPDPEFYFNSGVLLIDVEAWQREAVTERAFEFTCDLPGGAKLLYPDQDILNAILSNRWHPLDRKWNFFNGADGPMDPQQFRIAAIVHFASGKKPWVSGSTHPARQIYLEYRQRTPFAGRAMNSLAKHRLNQFLRSPAATLRTFSMRLRGPIAAHIAQSTAVEIGRVMRTIWRRPN